jgi:hypothetical protein
MPTYSKNPAHSIIEPSGRGRRHVRVAGNHQMPVHHDGSLARVADGGAKLKAATPVRVHAGMSKVTEHHIPAFDGGTASAIDALIGKRVPIGNTGAMVDPPLTKSPLAKSHDKPLQTVPGQRAAQNRSQARHPQMDHVAPRAPLVRFDAADHSLGLAIMKEAVNSGGKVHK